MAVERHTAEASASVASRLDLVPAAPSRAADPARLQEASTISPQVGNNLWRTPVPERTRSVRTVHRWKAPRAQQTSLFFAEGRAKRPSVGSSRCRSLTGAPPRCRSLQPALQRSHDERCPSGSGWGSALSPALARARGRGPLARETSAGGCRCGGAGPRPRSPLRAALPVLGAGSVVG